MDQFRESDDDGKSVAARTHGKKPSEIARSSFRISAPLLLALETAKKTKDELVTAASDSEVIYFSVCLVDRPG